MIGAIVYTIYVQKKFASTHAAYTNTRFSLLALIKIYLRVNMFNS